jgi:hypothetical protein
MSDSKTWLFAVAVVASAALLGACEKETRVEKTDTVIVPKNAEPAPGPSGPPGPAGAPGPSGDSSTTIVVPPPEPAKDAEKK